MPPVSNSQQTAADQPNALQLGSIISSQFQPLQQFIDMIGVTRL